MQCCPGIYWRNKMPTTLSCRWHTKCLTKLAHHNVMIDALLLKIYFGNGYDFFWSRNHCAYLFNVLTWVLYGEKWSQWSEDILTNTMNKQMLRNCLVQKCKTQHALILATKEVSYWNWQGNGLPYTIHVEIILFNQMVKERTSIMIGAEETRVFIVLWYSVMETSIG